MSVVWTRMACWQVWASKWNDRAWLSRKARGVADGDLFMACLLQQVCLAVFIPLHCPTACSCQLLGFTQKLCLFPSLVARFRLFFQQFVCMHQMRDCSCSLPLRYALPDFQHTPGTALIIATTMMHDSVTTCCTFVRLPRCHRLQCRVSGWGSIDRC